MCLLTRHSLQRHDRIDHRRAQSAKYQQRAAGDYLGLAMDFSWVLCLPDTA